MTLLAEQGLDNEQLQNLWREFKADYFLRYSPTQIAWHSRNIIGHDKHKPLVLISTTPYRGGTEVFVYTKERSGIFATTVALLGNKKLSIHDAKIITSKTGYTVNTFVVLDAHNKPIDDPYRAQEIAKALAKKLSQRDLSDITLQPVSKRFKQFKLPTRVSFIESNTKRTTLMEIVALDRPGLLASVAQVFQDDKINIQDRKSVV